MASKRTLVKAVAGNYCIDFRTVSRAKKSPQRFLIVRDCLEELCDKKSVIVSDIHSFALLRLNENTGMLTIDFTWLSGSCGGSVGGWRESVTIPYDKLLDFMRESTKENGPQTWRHLSVCAVTQPKLVFHDQRRLHECLENKTVRGKLVHALRDNFKYPGADQINFYHDFAPYSFFFQEVCNGCEGMSGGLIFHNHQNDLQKAYYSVHT